MKVFIGGSRSINELDENVVRILFDELNSNVEFLVGDADGVDAQIQNFCKSQNYNKVLVYASNGKARNNVGNFKVKNITVDKNTFRKEFFVKKDEAMTNDADYGIVIWDSISKGSLNQLHRMVKQNKPCKVYIAKDKRWITIESEHAIKGITSLKSTLTTNSRQLSFI
jgi:hypothetical protein